MREALAVNEAFSNPGFAQMGVVRPEAEALVVASDGNDAAIAQHLRHTEVVDQAVVIKFTALGRMDVTCAGTRPGRHLLMPINNRDTDGKRGPDGRA